MSVELEVRRFAFALVACSLACSAETAAPESMARSLAPSGIRRLTSYEYDAVASRLLARNSRPGDVWTPPAVQHGFSRSRTEVVTGLLATRLDEQARELARSAVEAGFADGVFCDVAERGCAELIVTELGSRAFARPLTSDEVARYRDVLSAGAVDGGTKGAVALLLRALLQSPSLLYLSEIGHPGERAGVYRLDEYEAARALSFAVSGLPPDEPLLTAAARGELRDGAGRRAQASRLLTQSDARLHFRRFVEEWLGISELARTKKDPIVYPEYESLRDAMLAETREFVDEVMIHEGARLAALLDGGFSVAPAALAPLYGVSAPAAGGRVDLTDQGRVGILQHASFLAVHSHESNSGPVLRGVAVLRRLLCRALPNPIELGIEVIPPPPDPSLTTRERYSVHSTDSACAGCHGAIDAVGFVFEGFDAIGRARSSQAGKSLDTRGGIQLESGRVELGDSAQLSRALSEDPEAERCLVRQLFRFMTGLAAPDAEDQFVAVADGLDAGRRASLAEIVLAYVESSSFLERSAP